MTAATITGTVNGNASGMSVGTTAGMPAAATVLGNAAPATTAGATATAGIRPAAVERERARRLIQAALDRAVERGEVAALSWQAVAHGADTVQFFQMRQSIGGCERFHGVVIAHDGTERSRVFRETAALRTCQREESAGYLYGLRADRHLARGIGGEVARRSH